jgi:serine/threonine protein kinase
MFTSRLSFDDFEINEIIGAGTVGTIFRAVHRESGQQHALKLLSPAVSSDRIVVARFEREMMILAKLNHPNIISYFGQGRQKEQVFYVMELVVGGTLKGLLARDGRLTWTEAAECGRQISSALQHAHNHGIIHRDLKPGNVFFTEEGVLKLGDFGIARDLKSADITDAGLTVGTYAYMAPELVRGERAITGNVDLYALGCLLFEVCTGRPPFVGDNFPQIFDQHLNAPIPSLRTFGVDCPQEFDDLVSKLLQKDPENRPFNARTVQGQLGEMTSNETLDVAVSRDRAAGSVRLGQELLRRRMMTLQNPIQISWTTLAIWMIAVCAVVASIAMWAR